MVDHAGVVAEQLLFGYDDGHKLLARSDVSLSSQTIRDLLFRSDIPAPMPGVRQLTGVPLTSDQRWVLAGTWSDPHSPRPGSVWTHMLIFDTASLRSLRLHDAMSCIRGPEHRRLTDYRQAVKVPRSGALHDEIVSDIALRRLVSGIYGWPNDPALMHLDIPTGEVALAMAWEQQWPELRAMFSFATRLQAPRVAVDVITITSTPPTRVRSSVIVEKVPPSTAWVGALAKDAQNPSALRDFVHAYGPDGTRGLADMPILVALHRELQYATNADARFVYERIMKSFPEDTSMLALKMACLGDEGKVWTVSEHCRLELAIEFWPTDRWAALHLLDRVIAVANRDASRGGMLLDQLLDASLDGQQVLDAISQRVNAATVRNLVSRRPDDAEALLRMRPDLAPKLDWSDSEPWQPSVLRAWRLTIGVMSQLLKHFAGINRGDLAATMVTSQDPKTVKAVILEHLSSPPTASQVDALVALLAGDAEMLHRLANDERAEAPIALASASCLTRTPVADQAASRHQQRLLRATNVEDRVRERLDAVLLRLAFTDRLADFHSAIPIAARVHQRLLIGNAVETWGLLAESLDLHVDWDRGDALRTRLLHWLAAHEPDNTTLTELCDAFGDARPLLLESARGTGLRKRLKVTCGEAEW